MGKIYDQLSVDERTMIQTQQEMGIELQGCQMNRKTGGRHNAKALS